MDKQAQHTPGPWTYEFVEMGGYDCLTDAFAVKAAGQRIADLDLASYGQRAQDAVSPAGYQAAEANAHLIAAAPDMQVALHELRALVLGECPRLLDEDLGGDSALALRIESALAKSRGE